MSIDKIILTIFGIAGTIFNYWFFLMKKEEEVIVQGGSVDIIADGGYKPDVVSIPKGKTTTITFLRKDPSSCLEEVVLSDFKIRKYLPLNKKVSIEVKPEQSGVFSFACGMNMFHGKIIVK